MKKIIYTLFAFAAVTFVSCTKEESTPENEQTQPEVELVPMTFTAGVDTKVTLGEKNAINWEETDKISIFDGTDNREFTIVKGSITGNTATFTGEVAATAKDFVALYPYTKDASYTDGKITGVPLSKTGKFAPVATASASLDNNTLNFTTVIGFVKFKLADADGVTSVTISGNNGELIGGSITIDTKEGKTTAVAPAITLAPAGGISANTEYYIPMAACTIPSGITISTTNGTKYSYKTSAHSTTISENKAFNLGSLSGFSSTPKNYVKWIHGDSFTIGGQTFNQAANGQATLLNSTSTANVNKGVYFIDSDVKDRTMGSQNSIIVIGNDPSKRSALKRTGYTYIPATANEDNWVLSNIDLSVTDINTGYVFRIYAAQTVENLIIDNCSISIAQTAESKVNSIPFFYDSYGADITNFIIKDSEFIGIGEVSQNLFQQGSVSSIITNATFDNNVFYTEDINNPTTQFALISASNATVSNLVINKNTFYGANISTNVTNCKIGENGKVTATYNWFTLNSGVTTNLYIINSKANTAEFEINNNGYNRNNSKGNLYAISDSNKPSSGTITSVNPSHQNLTLDWDPANNKFKVHNTYGATR